MLSLRLVALFALFALRFVLGFVLGFVRPFVQTSFLMHELEFPRVSWMEKMPSIPW